MASDLQSLYKMRDILKREEYIKAYNAGVNENLKKAVVASLGEQQRQKKDAWWYYNEAREESIRAGSVKKNTVIPFVIFIVIFAVMLSVTLSVCENTEYGLMYFFTTCANATLYLLMGLSENLLKLLEKNREPDHYGFKKAVYWIFLVSSLILSAVFAVSSGTLSGGFWSWVLAIIVLWLWPIANFFFVARASWWMLVVLAVMFITIISVAIAMTSVDVNNQKVEADPNVRSAKARYDKACADYDAAYKSQYAKMKDAFFKTLKPDTTTQEKRAMLPIIPQQFQNFDMVNKLIWCIEQKYAYDIVTARNWYLQQEHNAAMMQSMNNIAEQARRSNDIAAQAAADARIAHTEAMKAIDEMNKNIQKGNKIAQSNAAANQQAADYAKKTHDQLKYGTINVTVKK